MHQARVGLRRLRYALRDFGGWSDDIDENAVAGARQLAGQLSAARDRDETFESLDVESRHRTRKWLKRLRYSADFFSSLWPAQGWAAYQLRLRDAQEALGALQDVEAA